MNLIFFAAGAGAGGSRLGGSAGRGFRTGFGGWSVAKGEGKLSLLLGSVLIGVCRVAATGDATMLGGSVTSGLRAGEALFVLAGLERMLGRGVVLVMASSRSLGTESLMILLGRGGPSVEI